MRSDTFVLPAGTSKITLLIVDILSKLHKKKKKKKVKKSVSVRLRSGFSHALHVVQFLVLSRCRSSFIRV